MVDEWQKQRKDALGLFHTTSLKRYIGLFVRNAERVFNKLEQVSQTEEYAKKGVDMQDYFMRFTLDSFAEIGFGVRLSSIEEEVNHFAIAFDTVQTHTERRGRMGDIWPLIERFNPPTDFEQKLSYMNDTILNIIEQRITQDDETLEQSPDALSSIILTARRNNNLAVTQAELRDFVMNFLIAGRLVFTKQY